LLGGLVKTLRQHLGEWAADRAVKLLEASPRGQEFLAQSQSGRTEGWESGPHRRRPRADLVSQDEEYNYGTRERMMAEARALCQTFGIGPNILGKFANYCVGNCDVDFHTGDDSWDEQAEAILRERFKTIDVKGERSFPRMAKLAVKSMIRDGDVGFIKTLEHGFPQLQVIEADRIRTTGVALETDLSDDWIGGVNINRVGRPLQYRVWERERWGNTFKNSQEIEAQNFILLKDPQRFDGCRGITWFERGALNHMRDLKEILGAEKKTVKMLSKLAMFFKKLAGGKPVAALNLGFGPKQDGTGDVHTEELHDGTNIYGLPGEDAGAIVHNRPSPTFQGFLEFLIRDIAISLELPFGFVWAMLGTGPAIRLDSRLAEKTFSDKTDLLEEQLFDPACAWIINWEMRVSKRLRFNPNWMLYTFPRPVLPSIDVGRESKADLEELDRGITCEIDLAQDRAKNAIRMLRKKAKFRKAAQEIAVEFGVPVKALIGPFATASEEDEEEPDADDKDGGARQTERRE
jgi:hypothetical protein